MDSIYTPIGLANQLVSLAHRDDVRSMADFAAGDGALLNVGRMRWPKAKIFANDIDRSVSDRLRLEFPSAEIRHCDFVNERSFRSSHKLLKGSEGVDLILLNPPFSCRGDRLYEIKWNERYYKGSIAAVFILKSLRFMSNVGEMLAIVPVSMLRSLRDKEIVDYIKQNYIFNEMERLHEMSFKGCSPSISLIRIKAGAPKLAVCESSKHQLSTAIDNVDVIRGSIPVWKANVNEVEKKVQYIHTTEIKNGVVLRRWSNNIARNCISGDVILIPRVGRPRADKIVLYRARCPIALSDCVIGIQSRCPIKLWKIYYIILMRWKSFSNMYTGTGAQYITVRDVLDFINIEVR